MIPTAYVAPFLFPIETHINKSSAAAGDTTAGRDHFALRILMHTPRLRRRTDTTR